MKKLISLLTTLFLLCAMSLGALHTAYAPIYGNDMLPIGYHSVMRLVLDGYASRAGAIVLQYKDLPIFTFARPITGADVYIYTNWDVTKNAIGICKSCPGMGQAVNGTSFSEFAHYLENSGWRKLTREQIPQVLPGSMAARATLAISVLRAMAFSETMITVIPVIPALMPLPADVQT